MRPVSLLMIGLFSFITFYLTGCSSTSRQNQAESAEAMKSVAGALGGQPIDDKKLKELSEDIRKDPEAQSAIESVTGTLSGQNVNIKYCPVDGKRYSGHIELCPEHNVPLKPLDE